jgi:hypothetical protein
MLLRGTGVSAKPSPLGIPLFLSRKYVASHLQSLFFLVLAIRTVSFSVLIFEQSTFELAYNLVMPYHHCVPASVFAPTGFVA